MLSDEGVAKITWISLSSTGVSGSSTVGTLATQTTVPNNKRTNIQCVYFKGHHPKWRQSTFSLALVSRDGLGTGTGYRASRGRCCRRSQFVPCNRRPL
jgi:hypothetical protein